MALNLCAPLLSNPATSPLVLADRLLHLAQDADRAGFRDAASQMVALAYAVMDDGALPLMPPRATGSRLSAATH